MSSITDQKTAQPATPYIRFIVLSGPRTGSHMIAQALNSHTDIICFREAFNMRLDFVQFGVEGYDDFDAKDIARRKEDPLRFLDERIFCRHAPNIRAVGFKLHYSHHWDAPDVLQRVTNDADLRIVHLRRRNLIRALVSLKIAESTGVWLQEGQRPVTTSNMMLGLRHPVRAWRRIPGLLRRKRVEQPARGRPRVTITPQECFEYIVKSNIVTTNYEERFARHLRHDVFYEDLIDDRDETLAGVQRFLDVRQQKLVNTMRRQNPEPLRDLIENFDELYAAFEHSEYADYFGG